MKEKQFHSKSNGKDSIPGKQMDNDPQKEKQNSVKQKLKIFRKRFFRPIIIALVLVFFTTLFCFLFYFSLPEVSNLAKENPKMTALMEYRQKEAEQDGKKLRIQQKWISFASVPEQFKLAIRISEDAGFYFHEGFDYEEFKESLKKNWETGRFARGGSTITQQLAKNLFLSPEKSILRKVREYFIAQRLESELTKNRIFSLYLNVIEFGPGIFGVEKAAQIYFHKSCSELNLEEIVRLVAVIPRPLSVHPNSKTRWLFWKCRWISDKLFQYEYIDKQTHDYLINRFTY